jgi:hypothetical protein
MLRSQIVRQAAKADDEQLGERAPETDDRRNGFVAFCG